jgi:transcriptional regulator with XRE-family HTH domain
MNDHDMNIDASDARYLDHTRDYRDELRELLDAANHKTGISRYRLCKQMGIDSGTLSNVLSKRRHFSLEKLMELLALLGYRITFTGSSSAKRYQDAPPAEKKKKRKASLKKD